MNCSLVLSVKEYDRVTPDDTLWDFEPHTLAKHQILDRYLKAWAPILGHSGYQGRIVYIDGFAGPGEDSTHSHLGSPALALDLLLNHRLAGSMRSEIMLFFIEEREDRARHLTELITNMFPESTRPNNIKLSVQCGDFNSVLKDILDDLESKGSKLAPTFCFVDPFGWDDINIDLLARFMCQEKAELFITFMVGFIDRFIFDDNHLPSIRRLYSERQILAVKQEDKAQREEMLLNFLVQNINERMKTRGEPKDVYTISFRAGDGNNRLLYYLVYLTSHWKGMDVMKEAMYSVSHDGQFRFSDFDFNPHQKSLVDYGLGTGWEESAADELYSYIKSAGAIGLWLRVDDVKRHIILRTKYVYRKGILEHLQKSGKIEVVGQQRPYTYPPGRVHIRFR